MSGGIQFPDGLAKGSIGFLPPMLAPELTVAQATGNDLTWVAGRGGAKGIQPITWSNPNGDFQGVPLISLRKGQV